MLAVFLAGAVWTSWGWWQVGASRRRTVLLAIVAGLLLAIMMVACGGGGGGGGGSTNPGTPGGTYTLIVTGTVGSGTSALSHSVTLSLNVN